MKKEIIQGINYKYKHVLLACCELVGVEVVDDLFQAIEQLQAEIDKTEQLACRQHDEITELKKKLGIEDPWHNVADTEQIKQLQSDLTYQTTYNIELEQKIRQLKTK